MFRIKLITITSSLFALGVSDATTASGSGLDTNAGTWANGCGNDAIDGLAFATGGSYTGVNVVGGGWTLANNDTMDVAADLTNGFVYYRQNGGAWFNSGDPTSGATGTGHVCAITGSPTVFPVGSLFAGADVMQLNTIPGSLPAGYSTWN